MRNLTKTLRMFIAVLIAAVTFTSTVSAQTILYTQSFDAGTGFTPPAGWTIQPVSGSTNTIEFVTSGSWPTIAPYDGTKLVQFLSFNYSNSVQRLAMSTPISTVGQFNIGVDFAWYEDPGYAGVLDRVAVQWSTTGAVGSWTTVATFNRYNAVAGWKIKTVSLPAGAQGIPNLYIAFEFTSAYGNNCHLDLAHITAGLPPPPPPTYFTVGTGTYSCNYPYLTYWHDGRSQWILSAADIQAAGGYAGLLSEIGFDVISRSTQTMNGFNIRMQNTTATTMTAFVFTNWTTVYTGTYTVPGTGWQMITLQNEFAYTGQNLLIEFCFDNTSYTSYSYVRARYGSGYARYYYTDGAAGCAFTTSNTGYYRPNTRMFVTPFVDTLTGRVTNCYNNTNLAGATVTAGTNVATTNTSGVYTFYNIPPGQYNIVCTALNFLTQTKIATVTNNQKTVVDFCMNPIPAYCAGVVFNMDTGEPIVGAKVQAGGATTYSYSGGVYILNIYPIGNF
ncbi:MAG: carboxypeptidase regulatory-like domain-containing protein, partial [Bacteroidota bacterium]